MNHNWSRILILTLLASFSFVKNLKAQDFREGYVIKNNNDSISGLVSYKAGKKNLAECAYKADRKGEVVSFSPTEIKSYGFYGDKRYISLSHSDAALPEGQVFVRVLAEGPISLYRYGKLYMIKKDALVSLPVPKDERIETDKGPRLKIDKRYVGLLNQALSDCNLTANDATYSESDITKLVEAYNKCKGQMAPRKVVKPLVRMDYQVFGGYVKSAMTVNVNNAGTFNPSYTIVGGLGFDVSSPRVFDKLFFSFQGWYAKAIYQSYLEKPTVDDLKQDVVMDFSYIKLPIGARYNFLRHNTPYIKAGFSYTILLDQSIETRIERDFDGYILTEEFSGKYDIKNRTLGVWLGVGYDYYLHKNLRLFAEFQFENADGFIGTRIQNFSHQKNLNFLLGIRF